MRVERDMFAYSSRAGEAIDEVEVDSAAAADVSSGIGLRSDRIDEQDEQ
jgi:hypothetical protein